ncbi:WD40 repeat-like protein [Rhizoclosmatium globosum]|uniref:WD40 repeat-like protein n=1 Tax=Rhizoclosmatium globosum TaxID=329046 RepID=A0A1Y2CBM0_9FUNG|nr:WD40 repeat-like protein [Rhizoclosmatium globosum]|eukprot:ORY44428.1 WD40 repeat-like protein [Rhizoclosmatium globosum]
MKRASANDQVVAVAKRPRDDLQSAALVKSSSSGAVIKQVQRTSSLTAPIMLLTGHQSEVFSAKFSPDGSHLASGSFDRLIYLWDTYGECKNYNVLRGHKGAVLEVQWSADGKRVYSASSDQMVAAWDAETGDRLKKCKGHTSFVNSVAVSRNGPELAVSGGDDNRIILWDIRQKNPVHVFEDKYQITSVVFSKDASTVFSGGIDNEIKAWDLRKPGHASYTMQGHSDTITGLRVSPDGGSLLSNAMDNTVRIWDIKPFAAGNRMLKLFEGAPHGLEKHLLKPCWSSDGDFVATGSADRSVVVWEVQSRRIVYKLPGHKGCVTEVDWHPTEPILLSCSNDKTLFLGEVDPNEVKN